MKTGLSFLCAILLIAVVAPAGHAAEAPVFGPVKYDVNERYGKKNLYTADFSASEALYLIKLQNGDESSSPSDFLALSVNGQPVVLDDRYPFTFIACFIKLKKENTLELLLKDVRPPGFRRPPLVPKSVTITVLPAPAQMRSLRGSFGLQAWEGVQDIIATLQGIKKPAAVGLAMEACSLSLTTAERAEALRKLSDLKEPSAENYLLKVYGSRTAPTELRAEAALAIAVLGNVSQIPLLIQGVVDPNELIRAACARGLSFFPEERTGDELMQVLMRLDKLRRGTVVDTIVQSGWKPFATMRKMADSEDTVVAAIGLDFIGKTKEPRSTDLLLDMLSRKDDEKAKAVIRALGKTGDPRATEALLPLAADPKQRAGKEVELADALADLGDQRAAPLIEKMIKEAQLVPIENRLRGAYRRLTGKNY